MWLTAALAAIALALAGSVRGETERVSNSVDSLRAYYLAAGAIERAILYIEWGPKTADPKVETKYYVPGIPRLLMPFPTGMADVEVIPEASKLNINEVPPGELFRLLVALSAPPEQAQAVTAGILDWRSGGPNPADIYYLSLTPSFRPRHASLEEIEELLLVRGMTPELYFGGFDRDPQGRLIPHAGLRDCVSIFGSTSSIDANTAEPAVLAAIGVPPHAIQMILARRSRIPFRNDGEVEGFVQATGAPGGRLRAGGNSIFTLRATARIRRDDGTLGDLQRSVAAMVKFMPPGYDATHQILRWYDQVWKN